MPPRLALCITLGVCSLWPFCGVVSGQEATSDGAVPTISGPPAPVPPQVITRDSGGGATVRAIRLTGPMRVDGALDEPFYASTPPISDLIQAIPVEGGEPTERTEAWISFDDTNIYVSARVWDSAEESEWVANEMRRDAGQLRQNDSFGVMLDTYYDRRNSYMFYTNPLGALADSHITNEGNPNSDWNPVWEARTGRFDGGWTVEMAIPFKSLRYRPGAEQIWGIQLRRAVRRRNEWDYLTFLPISVGAGGSAAAMRVSRYGTLVGLEAPPPSRNLEIKPYLTSGLRTDTNATPAINNDTYADIGVDVKYGITENLTADFTFNTDFAQVEVDEQQVNLTRFSLSFPEKREFFLEGRGVFDFGRSSGGGGGSSPTLFYSRRIGLEGGDPVPILAGGRITGKVGPFNVGALDVQTDDDASAGAEANNFLVLRTYADIFARSRIGALFTSRSRSIDTPEQSSQTFGTDVSFGFGDNVSLSGYYALTRTPNRTEDEQSFLGQMGYNGDVWGLQVGHLHVGEDFNPEIGFVRRDGFRQSTASVRFSPRPASIDWIRQVTFDAGIDYLENTVEERLETRGRDVSFSVELENSDGFSMSGAETFERLFEDDRISGATIPAGDYTFRSVNARYTFGLQRPYSGQLRVQTGSFFTGHRTSVGFTQGRVEILPQLSVEPSLQFNWLSLPGEVFNQHLAVARISYSMSPRAYVSTLVQYSSGSDTFAINFRLRWEWAPGSELFLVYTEDRDTDVPDRWSDLSNRGLVLKVTRLLRP